MLSIVNIRTIQELPVYNPQNPCSSVFTCYAEVRSVAKKYVN